MKANNWLCLTISANGETTHYAELEIADKGVEIEIYVSGGEYEFKTVGHSAFVIMKEHDND